MITQDDTHGPGPDLDAASAMVVAIAAAVSGAVALPPGATQATAALSAFVALSAGAFALSRRTTLGWLGLSTALALAAGAVALLRPTPFDGQGSLDLDERAAALVCLAAAGAILWGVRCGAWDSPTRPQDGERGNGTRT